MKHKNILGAFSLIFIGIVFGAILVSSFGLVRPSYADVQIGKDKPPVPVINPLVKAFDDAFIKVAAAVNPSIVRITVVSKTKKNPHKGFKFFLPFENKLPKEQIAGGSGVIISPDGYILTNNHVVENAIKVEVGLFDRRQFDATVIGADPLTDLAVVKINAKNLPAAYLGNSDKLRVGQWVMALGNPLSLTSTVTAGIISAKGRNLNLIHNSYAVENFIQTDAAINPGNSGGALVNLNGAVIGINSAIATNGFSSSYIGYGFAIPINLAKSVAKDLIANGKVNRGYIGVNISAVDASTAMAVGLNKPKGVMIQGIVKGSSASKTDIRAGDIIFKIDNKEVNRPNELQSYVASKRAGTTVTLTLYRDGKDITRKVKLKVRSHSNNTILVNSNAKKKNENKVKIKSITFRTLGLTVVNVPEKILKEYGINNGILIKRIKKFGRAGEQGLVPGLIITEVNKKKINNIDVFKKIVENYKGKAVLLKVVYTDGSARFVGLEIPE